MKEKGEKKQRYGGTKTNAKNMLESNQVAITTKNNCNTEIMVESIEYPEREEDLLCAIMQ